MATKHKSIRYSQLPQIDDNDTETTVSGNDLQEEADKIKHVFQFPEDVISVQSIKREHRIKNWNEDLKLPSGDIKAQAPGLLVENFKYFSMDWKVINKKNLDNEHISSKNISNENPPAILKSNIFEPLVVEGQYSPAQFINPYLLNDGDRQNERKNLFHLYSPWFLEEAESSNESIYRSLPLSPEVYNTHSTCDLEIEFKNLSFEHNASIEPLYCNLSLYDASSKKKISENFYFDNGLIGGAKIKADFETLTHRALFSISQPNEDIYLVLRIDRVLQGDPDKADELYIKPKLLTGKAMEKYAERVQDAIGRLNKYRQPFVFAFEPLFKAREDTDKKPITNKNSIGKAKAKKVNQRGYSYR
jgi:hypothetical protein